MIKTVKITNHLGEFIILDMKDPAPSGFFIKGIDGLGPSKSVVNTVESLSLDGAAYNSSRTTSRNLVFNLGFYYWTPTPIETLRLTTYRFFPQKKEIQIEIETDNRIGVVEGYVETNEPDIFSREESTSISVLCPSAFFHGKDIVQSVFSGVSPAFEFPFENPSLTEPLIEFGIVFIDTQKSVFYLGDEPTGVVIYINVIGNVNDLVIYNLTRGQVMTISSAQIIAMTGSDLHLGDEIVISTVKGHKYVSLIRNGEEINILNALSQPTDWFQIDRGDNLFTYSADSGVENVQFLIEHQVLYGGL